MAATKLDYINDVLYANSVKDIASMIESQIRKSYKHKFVTDESKVYYNGEFYTINADVTRYDDEFIVTVYAYDSREFIDDSLCGNVEDILIEAFEPEICENTHDIYTEQSCF